MIREHSLALCATDSHNCTPLRLATFHNRPAQLISLLVDATAALAARVHGSAFALRCLASPSYSARLAVRTSLLLCLKNTHPDVPATPTEPLSLRLAHARLCSDEWSVILEFV